MLIMVWLQIKQKMMMVNHAGGLSASATSGIFSEEFLGAEREPPGAEQCI